MNKLVSRKERGQVLVLLAIAFVALLAFAGLALDGGMVFSDRRHGQNAADASSLAGGGEIALRLRNKTGEGSDYLSWNCANALTSDDRVATEQASIERAGNNNYVIDEDISDKNGVKVECKSVDNGSFVDRFIDVQTYITGVTNTFFAQLIYSGPLKYTVQAVTRVRPRAPLGFGNAIISLKEACQSVNDGMIFNGGGSEASNLHVKGGGIFSNSCMKGNGKINVTVEGGTIRYVENYVPPSNGTISPTPTKATGKLPAMAIPPPKCSSGSASNVSVPNGSRTIDPGNYKWIKVTGGSLTLNPGLYCITDTQGFAISAGTTVTGDGVTLYLKTGGFTVTGSATVKLSAPNPSKCPTPENPWKLNPDTCVNPAIPGLLIYLAPGNTSSVSLIGNSDSAYVGTIFAPNGSISAAGTTGHEATFNTQLIGETVTISGNANIDINFLGESVYKGPPVLDLFR